jgi:hypothetical protein
MKKILTRYGLTLLVCFGLLAASWQLALAAGGVTTTADKTTVDGGERFIVSVNVDATPNLFGAQLSLTYDALRLNVIEVRTGSVWPAGGTFVARSLGGAGKVEFAATLVTPGVVPSGTLVSVIFESIDPSAQVTTTIANGNSVPLLLSDSSGQPIASTAPSPLEITVKPAPHVTGTVTLQSPGPVTAPRSVTINIANASVQRSTAPNSGVMFDLAAVPRASDYVLTAAAACHLSAQTAASVVAPSAGHNVTLPAGDVNGDNTINIQDLAAMGSRFNQAPYSLLCTDLDQNGTVNILDLSRAASNFGTVGPILWP